MAAHYFKTIEHNVTGKPVSGAEIAVKSAAGAYVTVYSDDGVTTIDQANSPIETDQYGYFEFWTNETSVTLEISYDGTVRKTITDVEIVGGTVNSDVTALQVRMDAVEAVTQDGDKGDITVSSSGTVWTIDNGAVSLAKVANASANSKLLGSGAAGSGSAYTEITLGTSLSMSGTTLNATGSGATGTRTIPVSAAGILPHLSNGPSPGVTETTTNKVMIRTLDFNASTAEYAQVSIPMPKSYDGGTVTVQFGWIASNTGNVVWLAQAQYQRDDDPLDGAWSTAQTVTDGVTATGDRMWSSFTAAITPSGTWAAESSLLIKIGRDAANASDTCTVDAKLFAVRIKYNANASDDS